MVSESPLSPLSTVSVLFAMALLSLCGGAETSASADRVPVMMWGSASTEVRWSAPLRQVTEAEFSSLLSDQISPHTFTVIFIEETLSVEDLSRKDSDGATPFVNLRKRVRDDSFAYIPAVPSALDTLERFAEPNRIDRIEMTDEGLSADIVPGAGKFLYITLKDAREGEDRFKMLYRHDRFMKEMFDKLSKKHRSLLAVYTARNPSWENFPEEPIRVRRQLLQKEEADDQNCDSADNRLYLCMDKVMKRNNETEFVELTSEGMTLNSNSSTEILAQLTLKENSTTPAVIQVNMNFTQKLGYWYLESVTIDEDADKLLAREIYAAQGFSYHCGQKTVMAVNKTKYPQLVFQKLQVQPFFSKDGEGRFGSAYDCVGVMTIPIWSGIFIVILLLIIIAGGIAMMMDIRTMDRFDDPKGKTITINSAE